MGDYIGIFGIAVLLGIAYAFSSNRKAINLRIVGAAFALQAAIAAIVLYWTGGQQAIRALSEGVLAIIGFANAGIDMVFGPLADKEGIGFSFAFNILANPGETRDEMRETLRLNARLFPNGTKMSLGYPFPGTEYHDIAKKMDLIDESKHSDAKRAVH